MKTKTVPNCDKNFKTVKIVKFVSYKKAKIIITHEQKIFRL